MDMDSAPPNSRLIQRWRSASSHKWPAFRQQSSISSRRRRSATGSWPTRPCARSRSPAPRRSVRCCARRGRRVKRLSLELGDNAPFIVFDDADIDLAIEGAIVQNSAMAARPASTPTAFSCRRASTIASPRSSPPGQRDEGGPGTEPGVSIGPDDQRRGDLQDQSPRPGCARQGCQDRHEQNRVDLRTIKR